MFVVSDNNGFKNLIWVGDSVDSNTVIYKLNGSISNKPTRTSIQIGLNEHIEDEWGQYINHSCDPTVKIVGNDLVLLKPLSNGDSITFDYNNSEDHMSDPFVCHCCGKLIAGKTNIKNNC